VKASAVAVGAAAFGVAVVFEETPSAPLVPHAASISAAAAALAYVQLFLIMQFLSWIWLCPG
jgi:hypothetical protein